MHVSGFLYVCNGSYVNIWGSGLVADSKFTLRNKTTKVNHTFVVITSNPYMIQFNNIQPAFANFETYEVLYDGRVLYEEIVQCPNMDTAGLFYIDSARKTNRDTYYSELKKIPNPTIRTGLLGE